MNQISKIRRFNGLSQKALADQIGVHRNTLAAWEQGEIDPPYGKVIEIATLFNVTSEDLMSCSDLQASGVVW